MNNTTAVIYDVRRSDSFMHGLGGGYYNLDWELLAAPFSDGKLIFEMVLYKPGTNRDPAPLPAETVSGYLRPTSFSGEKTEASHCYEWRVGIF